MQIQFNFLFFLVQHLTLLLFYQESTKDMKMTFSAALARATAFPAVMKTEFLRLI